MVVVKNQLQEATDAASLAAATALAQDKADTTSAPQLAKDFVAGQMANYIGTDAATATALKNGTSVSIQQSGTNNSTFSVNVSSSYSISVNGMTRLLGWNTVAVAAASTSSSTKASDSKAAVSLYLALDRSGSMYWVTDTVASNGACDNYTEDNWSQYPRAKLTSPCYVKKIDALKQAVATLFTQLNSADASPGYVRTGAVSYNTAAQSPSALNWGTSTALAYVNNLSATGGTNSSDAVKTAYQSLSETDYQSYAKSSENTLQKARNGQVPTKVIVLMTDGTNDNSGYDTTTLSWCSQARTAGMTIYTVAFMAPAHGQQILQSCAGPASNYYEANNMSTLLAAFKSIGQKASDQVTRLTN
jgi:Flp pilus assembly protein TadG